MAKAAVGRQATPMRPSCHLGANAENTLSTDKPPNTLAERLMHEKCVRTLVFIGQSEIHPGPSPSHYRSTTSATGEQPQTS